jgi:hypothetical protein
VAVRPFISSVHINSEYPTCVVGPTIDYPLFAGFIHLGAGLACGFTGLAAGCAIGYVGDSVRFSNYIRIINMLNSWFSVYELTYMKQEYSLLWF